MKALFIELPAFERSRSRYFSDEQFSALQRTLLTHPDAGVVIEGTGGLRKMRFVDAPRGKGARGGLRIVYYHWSPGRQFWLFAVYAKGEVSDLRAGQRRLFKSALKAELATRRLDG